MRLESIHIPEETKKLISSLGPNSQLSNFYRKLLVEGADSGSDSLQGELRKILPSIASGLFVVEGLDVRNYLGLTQAALKTIGVELTVNQETGESDWLINKVLPNRADISNNLRELAAKVGLYHIPGSVDLLDWLDEDVKTGVRVIPLGNGRFRYRHIGKVNCASTALELKNYMKGLGFTGDPYQHGIIQEVIEEYSEMLVVEDDNAYYIEAPTLLGLETGLPGFNAYRSKTVRYFAIGMPTTEGWSRFVTSWGDEDLVGYLPDNKLGITPKEIGYTNPEQIRSVWKKRVQGAYDYVRHNSENHK